MHCQFLLASDLHFHLAKMTILTENFLYFLNKCRAALGTQRRAVVIEEHSLGAKPAWLGSLCL